MLLLPHTVIVASVSQVHGQRTPTYRALRYNLPDINEAIAGDVDIHWYAGKLHAAKLTSSTEVVEMQRTTVVVNQFSNSILAQVDVAAEKFDHYIGILDKRANLATVLKRLLFHVDK